MQEYRYKKLNDEPIEIESVEDEHEEKNDFEPSFWWRNRRYFLKDFTRTHNNPWCSGNFPEHIHGMESENYYCPLYIELIGDSAVNVYEEYAVHPDVRVKMVKAMEYIVCQLNDETLMESWLMAGVADGDIRYGDLIVRDEDLDDLEYYIEDGEFADLMGLFLRLMSRANKSGGLYCDKITSKE